MSQHKEPHPFSKKSILRRLDVLALITEGEPRQLVAAKYKVSGTVIDMMVMRMAYRYLKNANKLKVAGKWARDLYIKLSNKKPSYFDRFRL